VPFGKHAQKKKYCDTSGTSFDQPVGGTSHPEAAKKASFALADGLTVADALDEFQNGGLANKFFAVPLKEESYKDSDEFHTRALQAVIGEVSYSSCRCPLLRRLV
jgi:hypothetical protein